MTGFVVTMTLWNRPEYTRRALEGLSRCDGVGKYLILPFVDPVNGESPNEEVWELVRGVEFARCEPHLNESRLNTAANTHKALGRGFHEADFVVHVEDDIVLARDALAYFEWCRGQYQGDKDVFAVTGYSKSKPGHQRYAVRRWKWFTCWGWGMWRDRWEEVKDHWSFNDKVGWAVNLNHSLRGNRCEIFPELSRAQNIGAEKGMRVPSPEWHRQHQFLEEWAGNHDIPPGEYFEIQG